VVKAALRNQSWRSILAKEERLMAYCPQCLTEYIEDAVECMDCRVPLKPGPPPPAGSPHAEPNVHFAPVRVFQGLHAQFQADLARNVLEAEGIECTVTSELGAELIPGMDAAQLLVREEDRARASELVDDVLNPPAAEAEAAADAAAAASIRAGQRPEEETPASSEPDQSG
jgi:Putative prokaryotic signal transducing protein